MAHQLRSRPIDVVMVIHTEFEDDDDDFRSSGSVVDTSTTSFRMVDSEAKEEHLQNTLLKGTTIPIPEVKIISDYAKNTPLDWKPDPYSYVRTLEWSDVPAYDLDEEDDEWLLNLNSEKQLLTEEQFEELVVMLEKLAEGKRSLPSEVDAMHLPLSPAMKAMVPSFYPYWCKKREKKGKPLIPVLEDPCKDIPSAPEPHKRRKKKSRTEKDLQTLTRMRQELQSALELLALIKKREEIKVRLTKIACTRILGALSDPASLVSLLYYNGGPIPASKAKKRSRNANGDSTSRKRPHKRDRNGTEGDTEHKRKRRKTSTREKNGVKEEWEPELPTIQARGQTQKQKWLDTEQDPSQKGQERQSGYREDDDSSRTTSRTGTEAIDSEDKQMPAMTLEPEDNPVKPKRLHKKITKQQRLRMRHIIEPYEEEEVEEKYIWCTLLPSPQSASGEGSNRLTAIVLPKKGEDPYIGRRRYGRGGRVWWDLHRVDKRRREKEDNEVLPKIEELEKNQETSTTTNTLLPSPEDQDKNIPVAVDTGTPKTSPPAATATRQWSVLSRWGLYQYKRK
eukprot:TRINITY_DN4323_c0_g1_i1.p1 TRINITY_DN4323_c0_g1~~TRINITY_DN4323_c0_g1_i1.p1  ORF type:complete len:563 (+),score=107.69 TRINITY_DN4323_c0_g1_i1:76-1764(+)